MVKSTSVWLVLIIAIGLVGCSSINEYLNEPNQEVNPDSIVIVAPDFSLTSFTGELITLEQFRGQIVILHFWASWCPPCETELIDLESLWQSYQATGEIVVIGITFADFNPQSINLINEKGITYLNGADSNNSIADVYQVQGIPETFIIDDSGLIIEHLTHGWSLDELQSSVDAVLTK